ncbi:MAG: uncharacterized protein KVP18_005164 [Porospora cf. gigantea A]|uniref:uncharacterized protein n=1 Tax=Porospora cf. gigantea A TaxID=2853593 RepID=UPI00355ABC56|nr:MAG: hypothetical protein KVP18_005164 [Porospora cf. gigantea A]
MLDLVVQRPRLVVGASCALMSVVALQALARKSAAFRSTMNTSEAYRILNLPPSASADTVSTRHKQLMLRNHPDNGGSTFLAGKINEAKDFIVRRR